MSSSGRRRWKSTEMNEDDCRARREGDSLFDLVWSKKRWGDQEEETGQLGKKVWHRIRSYMPLIMPTKMATKKN